MTDKQRMKHEMDKVRDFLADAIFRLEAEDGDIRFFSAAILSASMQLLVEIEGTAGLDRAIASIAARELVRSGEAGRC